MHSLPPAADVAPQAEEVVRELKALLSYILIVEKTPPVKWLASATGAAASTVYKHVERAADPDDESKRKPTFDEVWALLQTPARAKLLDFIGRVAGVEWTERAAGDGSQNQAIRKAHQVIREASLLSADLASSVEDARFDRSEIAQTKNRMSRVAHQLKALDAELDAIDPTAGGLRVVGGEA